MIEALYSFIRISTTTISPILFGNKMWQIFAHEIRMLPLCH